MSSSSKGKGYEELVEASKMVNFNKLHYMIFKLADTTNIEYKTVYKEENTSPRPRAARKDSEVRDTFDACKSKLDPKNCCFILYDFKFFNADGLYRNMMVLFSFVPEYVTSPAERFCYSSLSLELMKALGALKHISIHDIDDFSFDKIAKELSAIKKN